MIRNKDILNCLPLLASALGNRYGVKVSIGGKRAYTDGKDIHIPSLPMDCDKTTIALAKGYVDHESAHIRHTDFNRVQVAHMDAVTKHLFNSIEDWRVENCLSERYPGCRGNLDWLARHIFLDEGMAEAGYDSPASAVLSYVLLAVRSWDIPEICKPLNDAMSIVNNEFPGLAVALDAVLNKARGYCPDTSSAIGYAQEMAEIIRNYNPPAPQSTQTNDNGSNGEASPSLGDQNNNDKENRSPDANDSPTDEQNPENSQEEGGDENNFQQNDDDFSNSYDSSTNEDAATDGGATDANAGHQPACDEPEQDNDLGCPLQAMFDKSPDELPKGLGEIIGEMLDDKACENPDAGFSVAKSKLQSTGKLPEEERINALKSSNAMRHRLSGLLQADELKQVSIGRMGRLNHKSIYKLRTGNPRIFRKEEFKQGQSSAVHILLDTSYSMNGEPIQLARQACYAAAKALETIKGVSPAVTAFPATAFGGVYPLLSHNQRLKDNFGVEADGGTPLTPALWWVAQNLYPMPQTRKIILLITDGVPDHVPSALDAIKIIRQLGMEMYGIGIKLHAINELLPEKSRVIWQLTELAPCLFEMLQTTLLKGGSL